MKENQMAPLIIGKLLNIGGMLERKANQLLHPFGLNQQQFSILFEIDKAGEVNQTSMVNRLVLEKAHVSKVVKKLRERDLVEMTVSPADRRSTILTITPEGRELINQCREVIRQWNSEWMAAVDKSRLVGVLDTLSLLQEIFRENTMKGR